MANTLKWGTPSASTKEILQWIPNDGCLLIFNGHHPNFRSRVSETGVLVCHVAENGHRGGNQSYQLIRDLYITWKED